jgi:putative hemolysin
VLEYVLVFILVLMNAAFAGTEMALVSLRDHQLRRMEEESDRGRLVAELARDPNRFLSTIQIGITLAGFLASAAAAVSLSVPLVDALEPALGGAAEPVAVFVVTIVLAYLTLVLGELAPKRIAMQRAERWALFVVRPLNAMSVASRPVVWLLGVSTNLVVRLFGVDPNARGDDLTAEEVKVLLTTEGPFSAPQQRLIEEVIELGDRTLREILVPRRDVVSVEADVPASEALEVLVEEGRSRAPVIEGDLDRILGVVHLRDLIKAEGSVRNVVRPAQVYPETASVLDVLRSLQVAREVIAIVVNEHGGTEGIVTLEDMIEEVVGELYDEADRDVQGVQHDADGGLLVPGSFPVHDLPDLGVEVPDGSFATVAGLILEQTGEIPEEPGEVVDVAGWRFEVLAVDRRAITQVRIERADEVDEHADGVEDGPAATAGDAG